MGQQQLLLLVLSAVIVGLAIVVGINMFGENATQANQDAVVQDVLTIASRAQAWYRRPTMMGGGGRSFNNVTLDTLQFTPSNANGSYSITSADTSATVNGTGTEGVQVSVIVFPDSIGTPTITVQ
ncbi:MAG: hypothetical protein D6814_05325 [Calditrichaeota bacterium]|nr:MAG: hypothetical protein D6814_05325 [Calditrichota bacterium]